MGKNVGVVLGLASKCAMQSAERRGLTGSPLTQLPLISESEGSVRPISKQRRNSLTFWNVSQKQSVQVSRENGSQRKASRFSAQWGSVHVTYLRKNTCPTWTPPAFNLSLLGVISFPPASAVHPRQILREGLVQYRLLTSAPPYPSPTHLIQFLICTSRVGPLNLYL